jgi:hypothetical protein
MQRFNPRHRTLPHNLLFKAQGRSNESHHSFPQLFRTVSMNFLVILRYVIAVGRLTHIMERRGTLGQASFGTIDIVVEDKSRRY